MSESNRKPAAFSHLGVCTDDVERSLRFYTEALGFTHERSIEEIGPPFDQLIEVPGATLRVHYVKSGGLMLELMGFSGAGVTGAPERRPMNQLGFTHMTLIVDDLESACERVEQFGGRVHRETKIDSDYGPILFCTDPDGVRIELMQGNS